MSTRLMPALVPSAVVAGPRPQENEAFAILAAATAAHRRAVLIFTDEGELTHESDLILSEQQFDEVAFVMPGPAPDALVEAVHRKATAEPRLSGDSVEHYPMAPPASAVSTYRWTERGVRVVDAAQGVCNFPIEGLSAPGNRTADNVTARQLAFDPQTCVAVYEANEIEEPVVALMDFHRYQKTAYSHSFLAEPLYPTLDATSEAVAGLKWGDTTVLDSCQIENRQAGQATDHLIAAHPFRPGHFLSVWQRDSFTPDAFLSCYLLWSKVHAKFTNTFLHPDVVAYCSLSSQNPNAPNAVAHHWPTYVETNDFREPYYDENTSKSGRCSELLTSAHGRYFGSQPRGPKVFACDTPTCP